MRKPIRIMFVCLGNICRSPLAEGVFRHAAAEKGVADAFEVASSGTGSWHVGEAADRRMRKTAARHGVSLDGHTGRQFTVGDLEQYDLILAMDESNLDGIRRLDRDRSHSDKMRLFRSYDPSPGDGQVPDPYYGGAAGFENVFEIVDRTSRALIEQLISD